jgi:hypothetical protein
MIPIICQNYEGVANEDHLLKQIGTYGEAVLMLLSIPVNLEI